MVTKCIDTAPKKTRRTSRTSRDLAKLGILSRTPVQSLGEEEKQKGEVGYESLLSALINLPLLKLEVQISNSTQESQVAVAVQSHPRLGSGARTEGRRNVVHWV